MRLGARIGVDVGTVRVGVSRSDPEGMMAIPVETLSRDTALMKLAQLVEDLSPLEVIVGLPLSLSGSHTASTQDAEAFAVELAQSLSVPVRMIDERLSTVQAQSNLRGAGKSSRSERVMIDQAAAVILLQHALDSERAQGVAPGHRVDVDGSDNDE
ncbi:MAG TPA: Holliday junction resolvase RuvX [Pontimonas sp.]|nr:Holliday junction resolvase RuvX [Pontimonas sp.]